MAKGRSAAGDDLSVLTTAWLVSLLSVAWQQYFLSLTGLVAMPNCVQCVSGRNHIRPANMSQCLICCDGLRLHCLVGIYT